MNVIGRFDLGQDDGHRVRSQWLGKREDMVMRTLVLSMAMAGLIGAAAGYIGGNVIGNKN